MTVTAPTPRNTALGAPRANVGALVPLIDESEFARLQRTVFGSDRASSSAATTKS